MNQLERFHETAAIYRKHGWRLARVLMRPETLAQTWAAQAGQAAQSVVLPSGPNAARFQEVEVREAAVDALWFVRASPAGREAWELRLVAESPYALFEVFEPDEAEEDREDVRREMEARLCDHTGHAQVAAASGGDESDLSHL